MFVLGLLIGIVIGWVCKRLPPPPKTPFIACNFCNEAMRTEALNCPHCGRSKKLAS
jgi:hypothetical protein